MLKSHWVLRGTAAVAGLAVIGSASSQLASADAAGVERAQVQVAVTAFDPDQFEMSAFADAEPGTAR